MAPKISFMVADSDASLVEEIGGILRDAFGGSLLYTANDGAEALQKIRNVPPRILIMGLELGNKISGMDLFAALQKEKACSEMPILVISDLPDIAPSFNNDMQSGRLKFLSRPIQRDEFVETVRTLLEMERLKSNEFQTRTLGAGEQLFKEGDPADRAFLVRTGKLEASRGKGAERVVLGQVLPGEFVGEMAHITNSPRVADVTALEASTLIEIPCGTLDLLIFSKPTWAKALVKTLCRRLRDSNLKR